MSGPAEFKLPPLKYLVAAVVSLLLLVSFAANEHGVSPASVRSNLGLGSDGMPVSWASGAGRTTKEQAGAVQVTEDWAQRSTWKRTAQRAYRTPCISQQANSSTKANAAFVILARNSDVWEILASIRQMEDRFNKHYNYPYVFLNDEPFSDNSASDYAIPSTEEFKRHTSGIASGVCTYGQVPKAQWEEPPWIDEDKAAKARQAMADAKVIYGGSKTYRRMCRYQSGYFFRHQLLEQYDYYWRIEPSVKFYCDLDYDPFVYMRDRGKRYGWVVSLYEYQETIPTLWQATREFIDQNPQYLAQPNLMDWISNDGGKTYNRSNFEIGDLNFLRSDAYTKFFDHLDHAGGFSYERWGDGTSYLSLSGPVTRRTQRPPSTAPVHSIAAALFLKPEELHWFHDIGYMHPPFLHCPKNSASRCACNPADQNAFEDHWYSCTPKYKQLVPDWNKD
ncbi:SPOSA6832_04104 [Sporobolomyces salmonicolor]|uniref:SPOSA6832_04104-mRNA-1:cds n=1 Tax=Sporidiobolus salmonicolor TaxID=5005 RepID=A0A0D6ERV9_SPOSA|nr:SPOSA6832_04104 [Sporobolomyces salmonicolor]